MPVQAPGLTASALSVSAGGMDACAIIGGEARCWGINLSGQLGRVTSMGSNLTAAPVSPWGP